MSRRKDSGTRHLEKLEQAIMEDGLPPPVFLDGRPNTHTSNADPVPSNQYTYFVRLYRS